MKGISAGTEAVESRIKSQRRVAFFAGFVQKSSIAQHVTHPEMRHGRVRAPSQKLRSLIVGTLQVSLLHPNVSPDWRHIRIEFRLALVCLHRLGYASSPR